jgi:putative membrane protein insertion efficiency factor
MKRVLMLLIRLYQALTRPWMPPICRFHPSCSDYTLTAIGRFGALGGGWLGIKRIARCHPFNPGGYDPVPPLAGPQDEPEAPAGESP